MMLGCSHHGRSHGAMVRGKRTEKPVVPTCEAKECCLRLLISYRMVILGFKDLKGIYRTGFT